MHCLSLKREFEGSPSNPSSLHVCWLISVCTPENMNMTMHA